MDNPNPMARAQMPDATIYTQRQLDAAVAAERERWKAMMQRAIQTCFDQRAHHEVMSDPKHFAAEALKA